MRSHRRRDPLEHVLVAGDVDDLDSITALLSFLPDTTYGQVYVETPGDRDLPLLPAPPRVTVTRIVRPAVGHDDPTAVVEPGDLLAEAVAAWMAEWIPDEPEADRVVSMWVGSSACDRVNTPGAPLERL